MEAMKVKCLKCLLETTIDDDDQADTNYRLRCEIIHRHLLKVGSAENIDCPEMRTAIAKAVLQRRGKR
jgi:hypothetical protein